jgi:glycosyltransferase involved in cell wall biosynthesis
MRLSSIVAEMVHWQETFTHYFSDEPSFVFVICSYNNALWYQANLLSIAMQSYKKFRVIYIDDASSDGTAQLVTSWIKTSPLSDRFMLVENEKRKGKMANLCYAAHELCKNNDIIIELDGDDFLENSSVLQQLAARYKNKNVWLTYGSFVPLSGNYSFRTEQLPEWVIEKHAYRQYPWVTSHLKTYYSWLVKTVPFEYLKIGDEFVPTASDVALMLSLLERAGHHSLFIQDTLCVYNDLNPLNDHKVDLQKQLSVDSYVRKLHPLPLL